MDLGRVARMRTLAVGATLIVNDRADLAQLVGADGLHLGPDDLRPSAARRLLGRDAIIGATTHSLEEIQRATTEPIDYVGFGPIGATSTKAGAPPPIGVEAFARLPEAFKLRAIPIGGIDAVRARELAAAGARQVAVGAAILAASDPAAAAREILSALGDV
jgi:thiamine-phosphate pyrophosphorylase